MLAVPCHHFLCCTLRSNSEELLIDCLWHQNKTDKVAVPHAVTLQYDLISAFLPSLGTVSDLHGLSKIIENSLHLHQPALSRIYGCMLSGPVFLLW